MQGEQNPSRLLEHPKLFVKELSANALEFKKINLGATTYEIYTTPFCT